MFHFSIKTLKIITTDELAEMLVSGGVVLLWNQKEEIAYLIKL